MDAGSVHQGLVVGVTRTQDHRAAVLTVPDPLVDLQQDGRVGPVLAGAGPRSVIRDDIMLGELPSVLGPERPVAEGLASHDLSENSAHVLHGPAQLGRPHVAAAELPAASDVLPVDGDQDALRLLAHGVGSRQNSVMVLDLA